MQVNEPRASRWSTDPLAWLAAMTSIGLWLGGSGWMLHAFGLRNLPRLPADQLVIVSFFWFLLFGLPTVVAVCGIFILRRSIPAGVLATIASGLQLMLVLLFTVLVDAWVTGVTSIVLGLSVLLLLTQIPVAVRNRAVP